MDSNDSAHEAAFRKMEESTLKLMEEFKIQDATSKSRGYERSSIKCVLRRFDEPLPDDNPSMIYTTQPTGSHYSVECFLPSAAAKRELIEYPDFPQEIYRPCDLDECAYSIVEIPGKGLGMVATQDIELGELIASERPLLIAPHGLGSADCITFNDDATDQQKQSARYFEAERVIRIAYERMDPDDQVAYIKLHNAHLEDGSGPLLGVMRTNAYAVFELQGDTYGGVFNDLSRINHSCCPNTTHNFDRASLSMQMYAVRDIKKGEEITAAYCNDLALYATRRKALEPYGIHCDCPACVNHVESDKNRLRISRVQNAVPAIIKWAGNPTLPNDLLLTPSLEMLELLESEGLEASPQYIRVLYHTMLIYSALGTSSVNSGCLFYSRKWIALKRCRVRGPHVAEKAIQDMEKVRVAAFVRRLLLVGEEGTAVDFETSEAD